ncbi:unnamed protein product [Aphanomyces euteiches]|uniref:CRAL-TRIO domain-containing protein n=1 Tax=Aphanomyces euteiches TaxID=100861 RepID=A0A6G0WP03_9STRA|nr:hypothetical protein Ae201684_013228 [Aphanomyces euteiches]KAH9133212.1 hypothetical protein AeRB84_020649 [Aphanomyces euteiches]
MSQSLNDAALFHKANLFKRRTKTKPLAPESPPTLTRSRSDGGLQAVAQKVQVPTSTPPIVQSSENLSAVKYGDVIRLCTKIETNPGVYELGAVGTYDVARVNKCLVGVALASEPNFTPSYFRVLPECYYAHLKLGNPVSYGDVVVLADMEDKVWNNKIGFEYNGHFAPADKLNRPGEMTVAFLHKSVDLDDVDREIGVENSEARILCYKDENVLVQVVDSNRLRPGFNHVLTSFRKKNTPIVHGGFLRCDGRGKTLRLEIHGLPAPQIESISLISDIHSSEAIPVPCPDHHDVTGLSVTLIGPPKRHVLLSFRDGAGSIDIPLHSMQQKNDSWEVSTRGGRRCVKLKIQTVVLRSPTAVALSSSVMVGLVLLFVVLYLAAMATGAIAATNTFGTIVMWIKVSLPLGWAIHRIHERLGTTTPITIQLTILAWELLPPPDEEASLVPRCFIVAEFGNMARALTRYHDTLTWRQFHHVDRILSTKQEHYHAIRRYYKHTLHKRDKLGHPIYMEKMGSLDLKALQSVGVGFSELFQHYLFNVEYMFTHVATARCPCSSCKDSEQQKLCILLDARGIGMRDLAGEVLEFVRTCTSVMQKHYPQRSFKIFLVNVPSWFGMIWKLIKPLLNESTRAKTFILSEADAPAALLQHIDPENLPEEYGGSCRCSGTGGCFENSEFQLAQSAYVDQLAKGGDGEDDEDCRVESEDDEYEPVEKDQVFEAAAPSKQRRTQENALCSGYLLMRLIRQKHFVNPIWLRRHVTLTPHHIIVQKAPKDQPVKYVISPGSYVRLNDKPNCFEVVMEAHSLLFYAETADIRAEWLQGFQKVVGSPRADVVVAA